MRSNMIRRCVPLPSLIKKLEACQQYFVSGLHAQAAVCCYHIDDGPLGHPAFLD